MCSSVVPPYVRRTVTDDLSSSIQQKTCYFSSHIFHLDGFHTLRYSRHGFACVYSALDMYLFSWAIT